VRGGSTPVEIGATVRHVDATESIRQLIQQHWHLANERRWEAFATLLHAELRYEVPQTREYIESPVGYLEMFRTWPGEWRAEVMELVCEADRGVCIIQFTVGAEVMTGITVFGVTDGKIVSVTDFWPDAYDPPPRHTPFLKRRPSGVSAVPNPEPSSRTSP
jgi:hypothetical protein